MIRRFAWLLVFVLFNAIGSILTWQVGLLAYGLWLVWCLVSGFLMGSFIVRLERHDSDA